MPHAILRERSVSVLRKQAQMKDKLFLVKPEFMDGGKGPFYCPDSLPVEGMLRFLPSIA